MIANANTWQTDANTSHSAMDRVRVASDQLSVTEDGVLELDGVRCTELIEQWGSPLYVTSERTLRQNYQVIGEAFRAVWPAEVVVLYAIKANNNLAIRAILSQEGAGGDVFGDGELYATIAGGTHPQNVVLNGPNKGYAHLLDAVRYGAAVNIDAEDEVEHLIRVAGELGVRPRVSIRIRVAPAEYDADRHILERPWGFSAENAARIVRRVLDAGCLDLLGFHMHVGRHSADPAFHRACHRDFGAMIVAVRDETGFAPTLIDIGGGFARTRDGEASARYATKRELEDREDLHRNPFSPAEYAAAVAEVLGSALRAADIVTPRLWLEPGRYICGNSTVLLGTVGPVKEDSGMTWVNVDASINELMRREIHGYHYEVLAASRMDDPFAITANVVGPLCTGGPLAAAAALPDLRPGDVVAFLDAGMYAETVSTQFNGRPRPATVLVSDGRADLIKEAESVQDVFARHRIPPRLRAEAGVR